MGRRQPGSKPLAHPKLELLCVERAAGLDDEAAYMISGLYFHLPRQEDELGGKRRSRIVAQALRRLDARIRALDALVGTKGTPHAEWLRHLRAAAELRWAREVVRAGGVEPDEWAPELGFDDEDERTLAQDAPTSA